MRRLIFVSAAWLVAASGFSQPAPSAQQLFEEGQYEPALQALQGSATPRDKYLAAQIYLRLNQPEAAKRELEELVASPDPAWKLTAQSAQALVDNDANRALASATQAAAAAPENFVVQYQLGLAAMQREDWLKAAQAFEHAARLDSSFAYAFYHAGLAYSKVQRIDQTAVYFDRFLKLAPKAPERPAVESVMRTLRGR